MNKETTKTEELKLEEEQTEQAKTYTEEEVQSLLQAEGDRRVNQAEAKWKRQSDARVSEAEKLAKMDEDARRIYELEQREKAIADREKELTLASNKAQCVTILASKGLAADLVDLVVHEDAEVMNGRIKLLEKTINEAVSKKVLERIGGNSPATGGTSDGVITKDSFRKMSIAEQAKLYETNRELYEQLTK